MRLDLRFQIYRKLLPLPGVIRLPKMLCFIVDCYQSVSTISAKNSKKRISYQKGECELDSHVRVCFFSTFVAASFLIFMLLYVVVPIFTESCWSSIKYKCKNILHQLKTLENVMNISDDFWYRSYRKIWKQYFVVFLAKNIDIKKLPYCFLINKLLIRQLRKLHFLYAYAYSLYLQSWKPCPFLLTSLWHTHTHTRAWYNPPCLDPFLF